MKNFLRSYRRGIRSLKFVLTVASMAIFGRSEAQNTDLPGPTPNIQQIPAGSLVIAMDNTNQANPGYFNLKAYGLIVTLMDYDVKLKWLITAGKVKDASDLSVQAQSINSATITTATSKITYISGSNAATINMVVGTIEVGMTITSNAAGIQAGTVVQTIVDPTHITMSTAATSSQSNKNATYTKYTYPFTSYDFKAGPFVVFPADTAIARVVIGLYNNSMASGETVNVFRTKTATTADIRYDLTGYRPKVAVLNDGGNASIHLNYMTAASIPSMNYETLTSATGLTLGCYTFASEPHSSATGPQIDSIHSFVELGGNFLAECHAIPTYENWPSVQFQTTNGITVSNGNIGTDIYYPNPDLSFCQFEGSFNANQGGSVQSWTLAAGSAYHNNVYGLVQGNTVALTNTFGASGAKLVAGIGGNVWYIGNHAFSGTAIEDINGIRMYMNAMLTPAATPACDAARLLPVSLSYFAAKKINEKQVQLSWATTSEHSTKEFVIERSTDGIHFSELKRHIATSNSSVEIKYTDMDLSPQTGSNFYRLVSVDVDGVKMYSTIVLVNMNLNTKEAGMSVYPNPAHAVVTVNLVNFPLYNNSLAVTDMTGATVLRQPIFSGSSIQLNVDQLKPGIYFVKLKNTDGTSSEDKLMVR
jgi:hypothetical protein